MSTCSNPQKIEQCFLLGCTIFQVLGMLQIHHSTPTSQFPHLYPIKSYEKSPFLLENHLWNSPQILFYGYLEIPSKITQQLLHQQQVPSSQLPTGPPCFARPEAGQHQSADRLWDDRHAAAALRGREVRRVLCRASPWAAWWWTGRCLAVLARRSGRCWSRAGVWSINKWWFHRISYDFIGFHKFHRVS